RQTGVLQHAHGGDAARVDAHGQAAKIDARPVEDLRPLRALEMLPAFRARCVRGAATRVAAARQPYCDEQGARPRPGPGDSRPKAARGVRGRPSPRRRGSGYFDATRLETLETVGCDKRSAVAPIRSKDGCDCASLVTPYATTQLTN